MTRTPRLTALALALALALSGCGATAAEQSPAATPSPSTSTSPSTSPSPPPSPSPSASPSDENVADEDLAERGAAGSGAIPLVLDAEGNIVDYCGDRSARPPFTGKPARVFGQAAVMDAFCDMVTYTMATTFSPLLARDRVTAADLAFAKSVMTPAAARWWDTTVARAVSGDKKARGAVHALVPYGGRQNGMRVRADDPAGTTDREFSAAKTLAYRRDGRDMLALRFEVSGSMNLVKNQRHYRLPIGKDVTYWMVRTNGTWQVDSWKATYDTGEPVPTS